MKIKLYEYADLTNEAQTKAISQLDISNKWYLSIINPLRLAGLDVNLDMNKANIYLSLEVNKELMQVL